MPSNKVLLVDKNQSYNNLFKGFRKSYLTKSQVDSIKGMVDFEILKFNVVCIVVYEYRDLIEVLKLYSISPSIIVASSNNKIIKKLNGYNYCYVINLTKINYISDLRDCLDKIQERYSNQN